MTGKIGINEHITQSQRSRLAALRIDDVTGDDDVTDSDNHVDKDVWSIDQSANPELELELELDATSSTQSTSPESTSTLESVSTEPTSTQSASTESTLSESTSSESTSSESTLAETTPAVATEATYSVAYDDSPWMPIYVRPVPELATESIQVITEASTSSAWITYELSSLQPEEDSVSSPATLGLATDSGDVALSGDAADATDSGMVDEGVSTTAKPSGNKKFSFLEWFSTQLASAELNFKGSNSSATADADLPAATSERPITSSTRFFTLRPTAVSYSGVQPLLRPKPQTPPTETKASAPDESGDFPVESPRSQKSLNTSDVVGFFPPMRRPSSISTSTSNVRPQPSAADNSSADVTINSPIYTFILNKGQNVQDVLTQLLADLTTVQSPADLHIDAEAATESHTEVEPEDNTTTPQEEQPDNKAIAGDVRLQSWNGDASFRPSALNHLIRTPASAIPPEATNSSSGKLLINSPLQLSKWNYIYLFNFFFSTHLHNSFA